MAVFSGKENDWHHKYNYLSKNLAKWDQEFETEAESKKPTLYLIPEDDPKMQRIRREYAEEERRRQERDDSRVS
jgi:sterol desaturase/sphingolipid hydroxylase (fatty acid hydroxylase superfamily)